MSTNRRQFLARTSALTGAAMAGAFGRFGIESASAQAADYKALVCLFQFGGADSNNMVVPDTDYAQYGLVRTAGSQVGIPQANLLTFTASRQGGKSYGFHPSLQPLKDLYDQKKLAIVANAGTLIAPITMADYKAGKNRPPRWTWSQRWTAPPTPVTTSTSTPAAAGGPRTRSRPRSRAGGASTS